MVNKKHEKKEHPIKKSSKRSKRLPLLLSLTKRAVLFFTLVLIAQFLFFITANIQNFLDASLILILYFIVFSAILHAFFCLAAVIECVFYFAEKKRIGFLIRFFVYFILFLAAVVSAVAASLIITLTNGAGNIE